MIATLDTGESATPLAELAVRRLCDWAVVSLTGEDGRPGEQAAAHRDAACRAVLDTYLRGRLPDTGDDVALIDALRSGEPVHINPIREHLVAPSLPTEKVRDAWRRLQSTSTLIVPLRARGETFGALAMVNSGARPPHTEAEVATAVEVARRGRAGVGPCPALRPAAQGRRDPAAQPAHPAGAAGHPRHRRPVPAGRGLPAGRR
jgi:GAF domain-containing protein